MTGEIGTILFNTRQRREELHGITIALEDALSHIHVNGSLYWMGQVARRVEEHKELTQNLESLLSQIEEVLNTTRIKDANN